MLRAIVSLLAILAVSGGACSYLDVDVTGAYSISLTTNENGCSFENWMEGNTSTGVPIDISQDGDLADAIVGGVAADYLDLVSGSHVYSGEVSGSRLDLLLNGTLETQSLGCAYFVNSTMTAQLDGDLLEGQLIYTVIANGSPDCPFPAGCESVQEFSGTRPPQ